VPWNVGRAGVLGRKPPLKLLRTEDDRGRCVAGVFCGVGKGQAEQPGEPDESCRAHRHGLHPHRMMCCVLGAEMVSMATHGEGRALGDPKEVVLAVFEHEAAADEAVKSLKSWDKLDDDVKLGAIGVLVLDEHGYVKVHKAGARRGIGKGVGIGAVTVIIAGSIISPLVLPAALGMAGATRKPLPDLAPEIREQLAVDLKAGKAAVGVLVASEQSAAVSGKLVELGGRPETIQLSDELVAAANEVAEQNPGTASQP
jgi:hypothetical protein